MGAGSHGPLLSTYLIATWWGGYHHHLTQEPEAQRGYVTTLRSHGSTKGRA